ncbi:MAG: hypothetical protein ACI38A_10950 [Candidatus Ornithomonoglobus sp.]
MKKYNKPKLTITYFSPADSVLTASGEEPKLTYAAENLNEYMFSGAVGAGRTTTVTVQNVLSFE